MVADLLIFALASAMMTRMLIRHSGPFAIFEKTRSFFDADLQPLKPGSLAELFNCYYCMSVWVSAFLVILTLLFPKLMIGVEILAIAFVAASLCSYLK